MRICRASVQNTGQQASFHLFIVLSRPLASAVSDFTLFAFSLSDLAPLSRAVHHSHHDNRLYHRLHRVFQPGSLPIRLHIPRCQEGYRAIKAMGSDSLEKPGRQHTLVEKFQIQRDEVFNHIRRFKPRSLKPWILIPDLVFSCLTLLWVLISSLLSLIWAVISNTLTINWSCVALAPQRRTNAYLVVVANSLTEYLIRSNPAHMGFKIFSRVLLALYAWIAIALWYGSPWGPGGQWPVSPDKEVTYQRSNIYK